MPYRFVVPLPIQRAEALDFTDADWRTLEDGGLIVFDLPPEQVEEVTRIKTAHPKLSANDCFCLVSTRCQDPGILLTGDRLLRRAAARAGLRVHGVLWVVDELRKAGVCSEETLLAALRRWRDDPAVFLPDNEIASRLRRGPGAC